MASIGSGSINYESPGFNPAALQAQIDTLFTFVGQLSAGFADLPSIASLATETVTITPTPALIDNTYTFVPWIAGLGTPTTSADLEITAISQVDDVTWDVDVTNNGLVASATDMRVVALFIDNP
jgi:hypothetical protein